MTRSSTKSSRGYETRCGERKRQVSIKLALEQAEAERRRRLNERIQKGEAIRLPPVIVACPGRAGAEKQRRIAASGGAGETREVTFEEEPTEYGLVVPSVIVTGVPRPDRDGGRCENCTCMSAKPRYDGVAHRLELERKHEPAPRLVRKPPTLGPTMPPVPGEWWPFRVQIRAGNGGTDPGAIIEGKYGVSGDMVYVEDDQGKPGVHAPTNNDPAPQPVTQTARAGSGQRSRAKSLSSVSVGTADSIDVSSIDWVRMLAERSWRPGPQTRPAIPLVHLSRPEAQ